MVPSLSMTAAAGLIAGARSLRGEAIRARTAALRTEDPEARAALERAAQGMDGYALLLAALVELCARRGQ